MNKPKITFAVLSLLTASLRAETIQKHNRGEIPMSVHKAQMSELDDLLRLKQRGRATDDPEALREWLERRHQSLPSTRETAAVRDVLTRLRALVSSYALGFRDGGREERGEDKPRVLAEMVEAERSAS